MRLFWGCAALWLAGCTTTVTVFEFDTGASDTGVPDTDDTDDTDTDDTDTDDTGDTSPPSPCEAMGFTEIPWNEGPYDDALRTVVDDFTVETTEGPWTWSENFLGCESLIFINYAAGYTYPDQLFAGPIWELLDATPPNVHYFFTSYDMYDDPAILTLRDDFEAEMALRSDEEQEHWRQRFHFVTEMAWYIDGWIGSYLSSRGVFHHGVDRYQNLREVGYLGDPNTWDWGGKLDFAASEAHYFNYEVNRDAAVDQTALVLDAFDNETLSDPGWVGESGYADVAFPSAAEMAGYDTLEVDISLYCPGHEDFNCPDWDYLVNLYVCDDDDQEACGTEIGRFITPYLRESRWITDISPMLAHFADGGQHRVRFYTQQSYDVTIQFRLSNQGKGTTPKEATYLYSGASFNETYNDNFAPMDVYVPADAAKVEIAALITGHGFGDDVANCAEFCNHQHVFSINGVEFMKEHPEAGSAEGCLEQVIDGTVPNQYGTWPYGRGGWCPGLDVMWWTVDITEHVVLGANNTIDYYGLMNGVVYEPEWLADGTDFPGSISMTSWMVTSR